MNTIKFSELLQIADNLEEAKNLLNQYLNKFNIKAYAFTYYSQHTKSGQKLKFHCVSAALNPWHTYYLEQFYADVDRTLEKSNVNVLPIFWDIEEQLKNAKNGRELRMRQESKEFGIDKGLSVPVFGPNNDFASLTLHQFKGETVLQHYEQFQFEWLTVAKIFYHYINKLLLRNQEVTPTFKLTRREEQCLMLTSKSWRVNDIAKELKISPRTVNFHIQNANKKVGTTNKHHSIYKLFIS